MGRQKENAYLGYGAAAHRSIYGRSQAGRGVSRAFSFAFLGPHKVGRRIVPYKRFCRRQKPWRTPSRSEAFRSATARRAALSAEMANSLRPSIEIVPGYPNGPRPVWAGKKKMRTLGTVQLPTEEFIGRRIKRGRLSAAKNGSWCAECASAPKILILDRLPAVRLWGRGWVVGQPQQVVNAGVKVEGQLL